MALKLPPHYANVPAGGLYDRDFPDPLFRTLAQLCGLAWKTKGERTPPATVLELAEVRNITERQMYTHLKDLKEKGCIRVENLGHGQIVIYPLRWVETKGAALSSKSDLSEQDLEELAATEENFSTTEEERNNHVVVVDSDSSQEGNQQQHDYYATEENFSNADLEADLADLFVSHGADSVPASELAAQLVAECGPDACRRELDQFAARSAQVAAAHGQVTNPIGLFIYALKNGRPVTGAQQAKLKTWYTQEEFERYFKH